MTILSLEPIPKPLERSPREITTLSQERGALLFADAPPAAASHLRYNASRIRGTDCPRDPIRAATLPVPMVAAIPFFRQVRGPAAERRSVSRKHIGTRFGAIALGGEYDPLLGVVETIFLAERRVAIRLRSGSRRDQFGCTFARRRAPTAGVDLGLFAAESSFDESAHEDPDSALMAAVCAALAATD